MNSKRPAFLIFLTSLICIVFLGSVHGQDAPYSKTSLRFVPDNVAVYGTALQLKRQWQSFVESNAMNRVMQSPFVQMGLGQARQLWDGFSQDDSFQEFWEEPANQELTSLLLDAISNEVFYFASEDMVNLTREYASISRQMNQMQLRGLQDGNDVDAEEMMEELFAKTLPKIPDLVPSLVFGFKVSDQDAARSQLLRLHDLIEMTFEEVEDLELVKDQYSKTETDKSLILSIQFDGKTFPFEEAGILDQIEDEVPSEYRETLIDVLNKFKACLTLGQFEDYLLIGIGKDGGVIEQLEKPGKRLIDRKEFASLKKEKVDLVAVGYNSQAIMTAVPAEEQLGMFSQLFMAGFKQGLIDDVPEELIDEIEDDVDMLFDDMIQAIPEQGAYLRYSYLTDRGYEGKAYSWAETMYGKSAPLKLANHLGGDPIGFVASRGRQSQDGAKFLRKYAARVDHYINKMGELNGDDDETREMMDMYKKTRPLLVKLGDVLNDKYWPSFGNEGVMIFDAQATSTQWHEAMPPSDIELPMLEIGLVMDIKDADSLKEACREIYGIGEEFLELFREEAPDGESVPEEVPAPVTKSVGDATMYGYELPADWDLDPEVFMPNAMLSSDTLALSLMPETSKRLVKESEATRAGVLAQIGSKPLMAAAQFRFSGLLDAIVPWVEYGATLMGDENTELIVGQTKFVAEILSCYRGYSSVTYADGDATVTHFEYHFEDLP